ncbi:MAG: ADP-ribosylglycohydrolase family protein, partial [Gemmatimonadota bacterium]
RGALLGLAAGDALGTTVEFQPPGSFEPLTDMVGGGPFLLEPGQWTDDTSMALCLAESLLERGGFDPVDQLRKYVMWWRGGYNSSTGGCCDIGNTVSRALRQFERTGAEYPGPTDQWSAGNGSIMRLAPVPMYYAADPEEGIRRAADSSRTTHGARAAVDASRYMAGLIIGALNGASKEEILSDRYSPVDGLWEREPLVDEVDEIARGSFKRREPPEIVGIGYVVRSLEAALWALERASDFEEGCLAAVNLGKDADTTGAVYGQIAGALYGASGIPEGWRKKVWDGGRIADLAEALGGAR